MLDSLPMQGSSSFSARVRIHENTWAGLGTPRSYEYKRDNHHAFPMATSSKPLESLRNCWYLTANILRVPDILPVASFTDGTESQWPLLDLTSALLTCTKGETLHFFRAPYPVNLGEGNEIQFPNRGLGRSAEEQAQGTGN